MKMTVPMVTGENGSEAQVAVTASGSRGNYETALTIQPDGAKGITVMMDKAEALALARAIETVAKGH